MSAEQGQARAPFIPAVSQEQREREQQLTDRVLASFSQAADRRQKYLAQALTRHLHAFLREVRLTEQEWAAAIAFLTDAGAITDERRQEFILLSDVLGASMQTITINNEAYGDATESTVTGPFFVEGAPFTELGGDLSGGADGEPCWVEGTVSDTAGARLPGVRLDIWEADADGYYDVQYAGERVAARGHLFTDDRGEYRFWGLTPTPYPIPHDGPVGRLLEAVGRSPMRASHLHFMATAPGLRRLITHIFVRGDELLDRDAVFGVRDSLVMDFVRHEPGTTPPDGRDLGGRSWSSVRFDLVLAPRAGAAAMSPAKGRTGALDPAESGTEQRAPEMFSTVGLPDARRVELWERHNSAALVRLDVRARSPLQASEVTVRLPRVTLARVRASSHAIDRSAAAISAHPYEAIAVYLMLRGESSFTQQGGSRTLRPGEAVICETDRPFARDFAHGLDELVVKVPCDALEIRSMSPVVVPFGAAEGNQYADALAKLAARTTRAVQPVPADERTVLDLVAMLALGPRAARTTAYRAAARTFIEERLTDPGLGADQVAAVIGISERHLSRLFAADGTSVPRYVLSRRLELARGMLAASRASTASVAEVAARCGFVSTTYLSHVFRRRFGRRAGEILRESGNPLEDW